MSLSLRRATLTIVLLVGLEGGMLSATWGRGKVPGEAAEKVTDADIQVVVTAIEDEIYANGYHTAYIDVGEKIPLYVNPLMKNNMVWVIYKLMPHGEIRRGVFLSADKSLAALNRDPQLGFTATDSAAMPTVYLNDDDVIELKTTWRKVYMRIELKPSAKRIEDAKRRQTARYGERR